MQSRIEDQRDIAVRRELLQQTAQHGGLARAHLAGQLDESAGLGDAIGKMRERLRMPLTEIEVAGVGRDRKWLFG